MYAALARAVLDEAGPGARRAGGRAAAASAIRAPRATSSRGASSARRRCSARRPRALLTGPAAFFGSMPFGADLALPGRRAEPAGPVAGRALRQRPSRTRPRGRDRRAAAGAGLAAELLRQGLVHAAAPRSLPKRPGLRTVAGALAGGALGYGAAVAIGRLRPGRRSAAGRTSRFRRGARDEPGRADVAHRRRRADRLRARRRARRARPAASIVLERAEPGGEASGAAAGMLSPQAEARTRVAVLRSRAREPRPLSGLGARSSRRRPASTSAIAATGLLRCASGRAPSADAAPRSSPGSGQAGLRVEELASRGSCRARSAARLSPRGAAPRSSFPTRPWSTRARADPRGVAARRAPGRPRADGRRPCSASDRARASAAASRRTRDRSRAAPSSTRRAPGRPSTGVCRCRFRSIRSAGRSWSCGWRARPCRRSSVVRRRLPRSPGGRHRPRSARRSSTSGFRKEVTAAARPSA